MREVEHTARETCQGIRSFRDWFADHLGGTATRKQELPVDISKSATLREVAYWLQIPFAVGSVTLGLSLNSAAVIIEAMLMSLLLEIQLNLTALWRS